MRIANDWLLHILFPPDLAQTKVAVESNVKQQHFEPGELVFDQGDLGDNVYVIKSGECEVLRKENGEVRQRATLRKGDYFGEMAVLSDKTRSAAIRAKTSLDVLLIAKTDFDQLRQSIPAFGDVFGDLAKKHARENELAEQTASVRRASSG